MVADKVVFAVASGLTIILCLSCASNSLHDEPSTIVETPKLHDSTCEDSISKDRVTYCGSVLIGNLELKRKRSSAMVGISLESKFFRRLECTGTPDGWRCTKSGHAVLEYPTEFNVVVEPLGLVQAYSLIPQPPVRPPRGLQPRRVVVRWVDSSRRVLAERSANLQEQVEAWTELRPPRVWYRTKISGVAADLASGVEVAVKGDNDDLLGSLRRDPNTFGALLVPWLTQSDQTAKQPRP